MVRCCLRQRCWDSTSFLPRLNIELHLLMAAVGNSKDVRGVTLDVTSRAHPSTFFTILPTITNAAHANSLSSGATTVASVVLLQRPILSRKHTRRDRDVYCLPPAMLLLCREMGVVARDHGEDSNLLVPRAGCDAVKALLHVVGLFIPARKHIMRFEEGGAGAGGGGEGRRWVG